MTDYEIVYEYGIVDLKKSVNKLLQEGYKCEGGICINTCYSIPTSPPTSVKLFMMYQAMKKEYD